MYGRCRRTSTSPAKSELGINNEAGSSGGAAGGLRTTGAVIGPKSNCHRTSSPETCQSSLENIDGKTFIQKAAEAPQVGPAAGTDAASTSVIEACALGNHSRDIDGGHWFRHGRVPRVARAGEASDGSGRRCARSEGMMWCRAANPEGSDHKLAQKTSARAFVRVSGFWMDTTHVTNAQFRAVRESHRLRHHRRAQARLGNHQGAGAPARRNLQTRC